MPDPLQSRCDRPPGAQKDWSPTPIDWTKEFPRSPQHLSNQLRGKRFNADRPQLQLFDDTYHSLPAEVRQDVDKHNIAVVGFDLSIAQQRAYDAALYLITATGAKTQRIVITPEEWLRAYGVEARQRNTRSRAEMSSYEREEAFTALASLGLMPWLISYDALVDGRWKTRQEVATLWQCGTEKDKDIQRPDAQSAHQQHRQEPACRPGIMRGGQGLPELPSVIAGQVPTQKKLFALHVIGLGSQSKLSKNFWQNT